MELLPSWKVVPWWVAEDDFSQEQIEVMTIEVVADGKPVIVYGRVHMTDFMCRPLKVRI